MIDRGLPVRSDDQIDLLAATEWIIANVAAGCALAHAREAGNEGAKGGRLYFTFPM
jgi:hypothetical protein